MAQHTLSNRIDNRPRPTLFAACGLILLADAGLWISVLLESVLPDGDMALADLAYYLPFVLLPIALYMRRHPGMSDAMRLNPLPPMPALAVVLLGLVSVFACSAIASAWGYWLKLFGLSVGSTTAIELPDTGKALAASILTMAAVPAICEELLFRGFAMAAWDRRGTWPAIAVTSALFALLHGSLYGLPVYCVVGAVAGFVTFALDSVYAGMVYHTVYNSACLILPRLLSGQEDTAAETAYSPFMMMLEILMILSVMAMLLTTLRVYARQVGIEPIPRTRLPLRRREVLALCACVGLMLLSLTILTALALARTAGSSA